ncbi:ATP-binding protein [Microbispora sp. H10670]|uniref:ATP-binding protein n=1 Tax=Microbispora sp. H10670 TaxID=2729108 RepID=UPI0016028E1D|nr:ATP-binding protein [Microbispora sp. H10670]
MELPGIAQSVPAARAYTRDILLPLQWDSVDEVELLVTELVANAVRHSESGRRSGGLVTLTIAAGDDGLWIDVADEGSPDRAPCMRPFHLDGDSGRGLWLVNCLATAWGVRGNQEKRVVWCHLARSTDTPSPQESGAVHGGA